MLPYHKNFGTKPTILNDLYLSSHFIFLSTLHFMLQNLLSPDRQPEMESTLISSYHKTGIYLIFAFSPYVLPRLMKKSKLSFLIPWQLFRQLDQIILIQL